MPSMICRMFEWGDLFTVGVLIVLEGLLSADNAMVMAVMVLGLPAASASQGAAIRLDWRVRLSRRDDAGGVLVDPRGVRESDRRGVPAVSAVPALPGFWKIK